MIRIEDFCDMKKFEEKDALMEYFRTIDSKQYTVLITEFANRPNNPPIPVFILKQI